MPNKRKKVTRTKYGISDKDKRYLDYLKKLEKMPPLSDRANSVVQQKFVDDTPIGKVKFKKFIYGIFEELRIKAASAEDGLKNFEVIVGISVKPKIEGPYYYVTVPFEDKMYYLKMFFLDDVFYIKKAPVINKKKRIVNHSNSEKAKKEHKKYDSSSKHNKLVALHSPHSVPAPKIKKPNFTSNKSYKQKKK